MLNFNRLRFPIEANLICIRWNMGYSLIHRHQEEIMEARGPSFDAN
jgi:transposase-like protein